MRITSTRRASRVSCRIPVRVFGRQSDLDGSIRDISRLGVRLRVHLEPLGLPPTDSILRLGHLVEQHLGARFNADLDQDELGTLVRKRLHVVRIGQECLDEGVLEVGCEFAVPLTTDELQALALELPPLTHPPVHLDGTGADRRQENEALLLPTEGWDGGMLTGQAQACSDRRAVFSADLNEHRCFGDRDVTTVAIALAKQYGPAPVLEAVEGHHQLWALKTRICRVESAAQSSNVHIQLATFRKGR